MAEQGNIPNRSDLSAQPSGAEESQLWRWALGLFMLMALAVAVLSWEQLKDLPYRLWAIPIGLLILSVLFCVYAFGRRREVGELKHPVEEPARPRRGHALGRPTGSAYADDCALASATSRN